MYLGPIKDLDENDPWWSAEYVRVSSIGQLDRLVKIKPDESPTMWSVAGVPVSEAGINAMVAGTAIPPKPVPPALIDLKEPPLFKCPQWLRNLVQRFMPKRPLPLHLVELQAHQALLAVDPSFAQELGPPPSGKPLPPPAPPPSSRR